MRVTGAMQRNTFLANMNMTLAKTLKLQEQIATGLKIVRPSDDPVGADLSMALQLTMERSEQFVGNIQYATSTLNTTDTALADLGEIVSRARSLMLEQMNASATTQTRAGSAIEIQNMLDQAVSLANQRFGEEYLFGGFRTTDAPFQVVGDAVLYRGDEAAKRVNVASFLSIAVNITGAQAFGAMTSEVKGNLDLNPNIASATHLSTLNGGAGVASGSILVGDGVTTTTIDLSTAENLGDVVDIINNDSAGIVTATLTATGITLTAGTGSIYVREVNSGTTALNLGILQDTLTAGARVGTDLNPSITELTPLSLLRGGTGFTNLTTDITIINGTNTSTFDFTGAVTVQDLLNKFNQSGTFVTARINSAGTGIDLVSKLNGARLSGGDAPGGLMAAELGILLSFSRMRLTDMNGGAGVDTVDGNDLRITRSDGVTIDVNLSTATTIQDVLDLINNDTENTGGQLVASAVTGANRIQLVDSSTGGNLTVTGLNGSFAADNLGILSTASGPSPQTLTGTDLSPVGFQTDSLFTALIDLRNALNADDTQAIGRVGDLLDAAEKRILDARAEVGSRSARLEMTNNRLLDESVQLDLLLADVRGIDITESIVKLQNQQTVFEASLATTALITRTSLLDFI